MKTNLQHSDGLGGKCPGCEDCNPKVARSPIRADAFWVVERFENGRSAGYWDGGSSRDFQMDIDKAIQFRRKEDAFWATRGWHWKDVKLTEHLMMDSVASLPEAQETEPVARAEPSRGAPNRKMTRTEKERTQCEQFRGESDIDWLIRMLEFHQASHQWFIKNPQPDEYVGDAEFHKMVVERYEQMIAIATRYTGRDVHPPRVGWSPSL